MTITVGYDQCFLEVAAGDISPSVQIGRTIHISDFVYTMQALNAVDISPSP